MDDTQRAELINLALKKISQGVTHVDPKDITGFRHEPESRLPVLSWTNHEAPGGPRTWTVQLVTAVTYCFHPDPFGQYPRGLFFVVMQTVCITRVNGSVIGASLRAELVDFGHMEADGALVNHYSAILAADNEFYQLARMLPLSAS